ncbi:MAG TPA: GntR family transcriptional regulator [Capsulimonadaceae bacterium]|jgi:DNA-binding LacI/PurR family transcriptional regulator
MTKPTTPQPNTLEQRLAALAAASPGARLPAERELAGRFGVTRGQLRIALGKLQEAGVVESRRGSGTYAVDPEARPLRSISLLIDGELKLGEDPFFSQLVELLQQRAQAAGLSCRIERIGGVHVAVGEHAAAITVGRAGRDVVESAAGTASVVALMPGGETKPGPRVTVFELDDFQAGRDASAILTARGCDAIWFVGKSSVAASRQRYHGAVEGAGSVPVQLIESSLNYVAGIETGKAIGAKLVSGGNVGLIANNDWLAVGLRVGMMQAGIGERAMSVPLVSFDGLPVAREASFAITSLAVPIAEIASDALEELKRLHDGGNVHGRGIRYGLRV